MHRRVTGHIVLDTLRKACETHGIPASTLTDNGMAFTTRLSGGKGGRNGLENELRRRASPRSNSTPNHPTTCGKVERFHQTLKKWLTRQPRATNITDLQSQLDALVEEYNGAADTARWPITPPPLPRMPPAPKLTQQPAPTPVTVCAPTA